MQNCVLAVADDTPRIVTERLSNGCGIIIHQGRQNYQELSVSLMQAQVNLADLLPKPPREVSAPNKPWYRRFAK